MTIAKKKVKYPENPSLMSISNMHDFVAACAKQWSDKAFEFKSIQIEAPATEQPLTVLSEALMHSDNLSFQISATDITRIMNQIILILRQPNLVAELLKDLDHALSEEMKKNGIQFSEKDLPEYVIAGKGHFIPGPPPEGYHPRKKARILDALLLKREMDQNVNPEGVSPKFTGFVDFEKADPFVAAGHIFTENKQVSRLLLHGSLTHRIIIDAIWRAKENGKLNFQYGDGKELSLKQLIELLVNTTHYFDVRKIMSLWTITIDYLGDTKYAPNADSNFLNTDNYSFSCR